MQRIRTEILLCENKEEDEKVYILELLEEYSNYYVLAIYGYTADKNLDYQLLFLSSDLSEAEEYFEQNILKYIKKGYRAIKEGEDLSIPGYSPNDVLNRYIS
jgi:hypothetical protein